MAHDKVLTIYAGAGATIDKSGVDWAGLVNGLLQPYVISPEARERLLAQQGPGRAATVAIDFYQAEYGKHYQSRVDNEIRMLLYKSSTEIGGRLSKAIGALAIARRLRGYSTVIVTPNFDNYIEEDLGSTLLDVILARDPSLSDADARGQTARSYKRRITDPDHPAKFRTIPRHPRQRKSAQIEIEYIHGLVLEEGKSPIHPVVSEID